MDVEKRPTKDEIQNFLETIWRIGNDYNKNAETIKKGREKRPRIRRTSIQRFNS